MASRSRSTSPETIFGEDLHDEPKTQKRYIAQLLAIYSSLEKALPGKATQRREVLETFLRSRVRANAQAAIPAVLDAFMEAGAERGSLRSVRGRRYAHTAERSTRRARPDGRTR